MLQSPAKRRKLSQAESVPIASSVINGRTRSTPTTPSRASYSSPTKASLARSNPHLLPRGRTLREAVLNGKSLPKESNESLGVEDQTKQPPAQSTEVAAPPASGTGTTSILEKSLPGRNPRTTTLHEPHPPLPEGVSPASPVPRLVTSAGRRRPSKSLSPSNGPSLPPTPVQLGLNAPPGRPRGLSSSSPRGSRAGSGSGRKRLRDGQSSTSSPLKPKDQRPIMQNLTYEEERPEEAPESDFDGNDPSDSEGVREKRATTTQLKAKIAELKKANLKLERATANNSIQEAIKQDASFLELLHTNGTGVPENDSSFESDVTTTNEQAYLDLFAPANLKVSSETFTRIIKENPKVVHNITVTAPSPWPEHLFSASFEVVTDAKAKKVEKVAYADAQPGGQQAIGIHDDLFEWISSRLANDLHRLDVAGLVWGVGMYFETSVKRAKVFKSLAQRYADNVGQRGRTNSDDEFDATKPASEALSEDEAESLAKYLTESHLEFTLDASSTAQDARSTRRSTSNAPKLMAVWRVNLTWAGEAESACEIISSGIPDSAHQMVADLFEQLYKADGFEKAFDAVWKLLNQEDNDSRWADAAKGKGKKRMRFT